MSRALSLSMSSHSSRWSTAIMSRALSAKRPWPCSKSARSSSSKVLSASSTSGTSSTLATPMRALMAMTASSTSPRITAVCVSTSASE